MPFVAAVITCRWVPSTLDRVRVVTSHREEIVDIREITRRFGREAMDALYLTGKYIQPDHR